MRCRRRERGQSLVELALVLPVFLLIVMATIDFGWALRSYIVITNSAREGARVGVVGADEDDIKARVVDKSAGLLEVANVTVTNAQTEPGTELSVRVDYQHAYISPLGSLIELISGGSIPDPLPISSTTKMRME
jgi:Flp pilus assembly protein TadG